MNRNHSLERSLRELGILEPVPSIDPMLNSVGRLRIESRLDWDNRILRTVSLRTLISIYLYITNEVRGKVYLKDYELQLPWMHPSVEWLADSEGTGLGQEVTSFFRKESTIRRGCILLGARPKLLTSSQFTEGLLLGVCNCPIPDEIDSNLPVEGELMISDQLGRQFTSKIQLSVDMTGELAMKRYQERNKKRESADASSFQLGMQRRLRPTSPTLFDK